MKKIAVIGLGNISKRHRNNLKKIFPQSQVIAISASGRSVNEEVHDADLVFASLDEAINLGLDMAIVASPATFHAIHAIKLISAGVPTLIEKPLAASKDDSINIFEAQKKYKTPVSIGYCLRYLPIIQELKKKIDSKEIGEIYNVYVETGQYLADWRPTKKIKECVSANKNLGGGVLLELSHEIDYLNFIFGDLKPVSAILRKSNELNLDVEEIADIFAKNIQGTIFSIHLDFLQKKPRRFCRVIGSNFNIECDFIENTMRVTSSKENNLIYEDYGFDRNIMYVEMLKDFFENIKNKNTSSNAIVNGINIVNFVDECKYLAGWNQ